jgi:hypothetical protein
MYVRSQLESHFPLCGVCLCVCPCLRLAVGAHVRVLLAMGVTQHGDSALLVSCARGRLDVAKWLVSLGLDAKSDRNNVRASVWRWQRFQHACLSPPC